MKNLSEKLDAVKEVLTDIEYRIEGCDSNIESYKNDEGWSDTEWIKNAIEVQENKKAIFEDIKKHVVDNIKNYLK